MPVRKIWDPWLFFTCLLLSFGGLLIVGSASAYFAMRSSGAASALFFKQGLHLVLGCIVLYAAMRCPYRELDDRRMLLRLFVACVIALVAVFFMPEAGGARRWILFPGWILFPTFKVQPSEFVKLFVVIYVASMLARKRHRINDPRGFLLPCLTVVGTLSLLILAEPDLGSALLLVSMALVMVFVAGLHWQYVGIVALAGFLGAAFAVWIEPYRLRRVVDFFLVLLGLEEPGYQLEQSMIAVGSGGLTGVGLGQGQQKAFVPAPHTDFIFSIVGEELGFVGAVTILVAFLLIFWRGIRTARRTAEPFGAYLALGMTCLIVFQALINMMVCLGVLPTTGLSLPLVSYGGSSLLASMAALGLLINVSQDCNFARRRSWFRLPAPFVEATTVRRGCGVSRRDPS